MPSPFEILCLCSRQELKLKRDKQFESAVTGDGQKHALSV